MVTAAEEAAVSTSSIRTRTAELKAKRAAASSSTDAPSAQDILEAQKAHEVIVAAQNKSFDHGYFKVDLSDDQIIGGGKERALVNYNPGIIISEKGRETDKRLDKHTDQE